MQFISYYMGFSMSSLKIICIIMLIRIAQYMQETWGSHHVLKRGGALQRIKNDLKIYYCKTITKERFLGLLM